MAARHFVVRAVRSFALAALLAGAPAAGAAPAALPPLAARIDGAPLYAFTVDTLWQQRRAARPGLERRAMLDEVIVQRLLAARAAAGAAPADSRSAVAFAPEVQVDERLVATLRAVFGAQIDGAVKALPAASLESLVLAGPPLPAAQLAALFSEPAPLQLEIALTPAQQAQAAALEVLRYQLPDAAPAGITLLDVYLRQNVQGRLALSRQPAGVALQQARLILANAFVVHWATQQFGAGAVADLRQAIAEGESTLALQRMHGIGLDTDSGSALLNRLAEQATAAEIEAYYAQHKDQFGRIERVRARHMRLSDEAAAQRALQALQGGAGFAATARSMSRAADAARGGDLGWISVEQRKDWLASVVFSQPIGKPSAPIRAPVGPNQAAHWKIVLVEKQVHGAHPLQSETVRYQASRMIALEKAKRQLGDLIEAARRSAHIEIVEAP